MQGTEEDPAYKSAKPTSAQKFRLKSKCEEAAFEALKDLEWQDPTWKKVEGEFAWEHTISAWDTYKDEVT